MGVAPTFRSANAGLKASATIKLGQYRVKFGVDLALEVAYGARILLLKSSVGKVAA